MRSERLWVLITDALGARICSTADGSTTAISSHSLESIGSTQACQSKAEEIHRAWYAGGQQNFLLSGKDGRFAAHLAQILHEGAAENAYDGLIIIAERSMARLLERALSPKASARLIGLVIRDVVAAPKVQDTQFPLQLNH